MEYKSPLLMKLTQFYNEAYMTTGYEPQSFYKARIGQLIIQYDDWINNDVFLYSLIIFHREDIWKNH